MNSTTNLQRSFPSALQPALWTLPEIAGRLVEVSAFWAPASLSIVFSLVLEAQRQGEPVGWVMSRESFFYAPDVARRGIDLGALAVIRPPTASAIPRAGEKLLRSGAFGLIVLDLGSVDIAVPLQSRLVGLVRQHHTAVVCLSEKEERELSLGSLISLRAHAERTPNAQGFTCRLKVIKDKRRGPTWNYTQAFSAP